MQLIIYSVPKELQIYTYVNLVNFCVFLYLCSRKFYSKQPYFIVFYGGKKIVTSKKND